jgi:hypothetical protein
MQRLWILSAGVCPPAVYLPSRRRFREIERRMKLELLRGSILLAVVAFPVFAQNQLVRIPGDRSLLMPGAAVLVLAVQKDGALAATGLTAEKDGVKPR